MDQVITTGMAKEPDQRYASTKDLATAARAAVGAEQDRTQAAQQDRTQAAPRAWTVQPTGQVNQPGPTMAARPAEPTERLHRPDPAAFPPQPSTERLPVRVRPRRRPRAGPDSSGPVIGTAQKHTAGAQPRYCSS